MTIEKLAELNILVVEDEDSKIGEWHDAIASHNADEEKNGFRININVSKNITDAKQKLEQHHLDAAIVDLRLEAEQGVTDNNSQGNEIVRHILEYHPLGVVVYTGQQADADIDSYDCPQVKVMDKADGMEQVFKWLKENKDVFLRLRGAKKAFNRETAKLFFRSIWPRWTHWTQSDLNQVHLTEVVARHVVAHVHDSMMNAGGDSTHPEETYFVPPLKARLDTGDLLQHEGATWIVVTPRCDLANSSKVATVLLALCEDISATWATHSASTTSRSKAALNKLTQHDGQPKQHFLHPMRDIKGEAKGPWMVQFHHLKAIPLELALKELTPVRLASLSPLFVPSLVERFGAYFSRIGTPGYSSD